MGRADRAETVTELRAREVPSSLHPDPVGAIVGVAGMTLRPRHGGRYRGPLVDRSTPWAGETEQRLAEGAHTDLADGDGGPIVGHVGHLDRTGPRSVPRDEPGVFESVAAVLVIFAAPVDLAGDFGVRFGFAGNDSEQGGIVGAGQDEPFSVVAPSAELMVQDCLPPLVALSGGENDNGCDGHGVDRLHALFEVGGVADLDAAVAVTVGVCVSYDVYQGAASLIPRSSSRGQGARIGGSYMTCLPNSASSFGAAISPPCVVREHAPRDRPRDGRNGDDPGSTSPVVSRGCCRTALRQVVSRCVISAEAGRCGYDGGRPAQSPAVVGPLRSWAVPFASGCSVALRRSVAQSASVYGDG